MLKNLFGNKKPKEKFSLENLKYLYGQLVKEPIITNSNKARIVEVLRSIAELMIWGDQHNPTFFEYFAEKNILSSFVRILSQKCDNKVKVQIIQTLSILVQNLSNEVSIFYILSNNYINDMIVHRFDFSDEEIVTYYINFLKSLSFKLNKRTIIFFYNEDAQDFPLFNEAIKFFNHADSMVRIAVRTLSLNIFRINDLSLRKYLLTKNSVPYFSHLIWFLRDQTIEFDKLMHSPNVTVSKLEVQMEHLLDQLYYIQDILNCGEGNEEAEGGGFTQRDNSNSDGSDSSMPSNAAEEKGPLYFQHLISEILIDQLLGYYILPLLLGSLVPSQSKIPGHLLISTRLSFFLLNHIFLVFSHYSFLNTIVAILVKKRISAITIRMIQEPPRGPIRNSDGTPLTDILYPKSASLRKSNVESELTLLQTTETVAANGKKRHTMSHSISASLSTPKPLRMMENSAPPPTTMFDSPSPVLQQADSIDAANSAPPGSNGSPAPTSTTRSPGSETELQPIALKILAENGTAANIDLLTDGASVASSTTVKPTSTTVTTANGSRRNSLSSSVATASSSSLEPNALDLFSSNGANVPIMPTALPPAPTSPPPENGWPCPQCTFVNPPTFLACSMCESVRPESPRWNGGAANGPIFPSNEPIGPLEFGSPAASTASTPSTPMTAPTAIANAGLASAYLSPAPNTVPSATSSPAPSSASATKSPLTREIPIDENSKARSKLPEVGPLYSPIDYFGYVLKSEPIHGVTPLDANSLLLPPPAPIVPAVPASVPGVTVAHVDLDPKLLDESEPNEYKAALLHFLEQAQPECMNPPINSPLHILGQSSSAPSDRSQLDERDLYGSLSVIYSFFKLKKDCIDAELLVQENLCSQTHRKTGRLLAALVSGGSSRDLAALGNSGPLDDVTTKIRSRSGTNDALFMSPPIPTEGKRSRSQSKASPISRTSPLDLLTSVSQPDELQLQSPPEEKMEDGPITTSITTMNEEQEIPTTTIAIGEPLTESFDLLSVDGGRDRAESSDPLMQKTTQKRKSQKPSSSTAAPSSTSSTKPISHSTSSSFNSKSNLFAGLDMDLISSTQSSATTGDPGGFPDLMSSLGRSISAPSPPEYNQEFVTQLLNLALHHPPYRMVTLQTMLELLKEVVFLPDSSSSTFSAASSDSTTSCLLQIHQDQLECIYLRLIDELRIKMAEPLWNLFILDLFEEEYPAYTSADPTYGGGGAMLMNKIRTNVLHLLSIEMGYVKEIPMDYRVQSSGLVTLSQVNGSAVSPPPQSNPMNEVERLRKSVQVLLLIRNLRLKTLHQRDTLFYGTQTPNSPIPLNTSPALQAPQSQLFHESILRVSQEILTSHHPDAMLCTLQVEPKKKLHLFFVMDEWDCILVELQQNKPGTAIVQLRQSLRHQEAFLNRNNGCLLHVTFRSVTRPHPAARRLTYPSENFFKPLWCLSLLFLDAIQCARAWKHLDARRLALRKNMLGKLCNELSIPLDEADMSGIAAACTTIQAYPGIEADVHTDSLMFGIPNVLITQPPPTSVVTVTPSLPPPQSTPQPTPTPAVPIATATPVPIPVATPTTTTPSAAPVIPVAAPVPVPVVAAGPTIEANSSNEPLSVPPIPAL